MKNYLYSAIAFVMLPCLVYGQDIKKLTIPSSPAFSILDYEPTAVMKPTSNKDLAADVLNSFDEDGKLLMNLGMEVTPYWLQSRPKLSRQEYLHPDPIQAIKQSFSLSMATVKDSASGDNKLGAGFRFKVLNGKPALGQKEADRILDSFNKIQNYITAAKSIGITTVDGVIAFIQNTMTKKGYPASAVEDVTQQAQAIAGSFSQAAVVAFVDSFVNKINIDKTDAAKMVATITKQRRGFILEFAGASGFNTTRANELEQIGGWVNLSNYVSASDLFTCTGRYMYQRGDTLLGNFDAGLSYLKKDDRYNLSVEYMLRWSQGEVPVLDATGKLTRKDVSNFSYRLAAQASYLVSSQISINISLGKDFDTPFTTNGFFSILGLNYSIFNYEQVDTRKTGS